MPALLSETCKENGRDSKSLAAHCGIVGLIDADTALLPDLGQ